MPSPSGSVCSTITTASAPRGLGPARGDGGRSTRPHPEARGGAAGDSLGILAQAHGRDGRRLERVGRAHGEAVHRCPVEGRRIDRSGAVLPQHATGQMIERDLIGPQRRAPQGGKERSLGRIAGENVEALVLRRRRGGCWIGLRSTTDGHVERDGGKRRVGGEPFTLGGRIAKACAAARPASVTVPAGWGTHAPSAAVSSTSSDRPTVEMILRANGRVSWLTLPPVTAVSTGRASAAQAATIPSKRVETLSTSIPLS